MIKIIAHLVLLYVFKGTYIQVGDIVSVQDEDDDIYYAQIKGFLTDQYCKKSAVLTWLLPTQESLPPNEDFDPSTYIIGRICFYLNWKFETKYINL